MPGLSGERPAREILAIRPDTPILLCTGYSQRLDEERARAAGLRAYLEKPLDRKRLAETLQETLNNRRA